VEQLITTVVLVCFNFALDVRDTVTHQTQVPAYYEVEESNKIPEVRPIPHHHLDSIQKGHLIGKRVSHRSSLARSRGRQPTPVKPEISG
jgi:hypothetical protein